jgi:hypothetical protein
MTEAQAKTKRCPVMAAINIPQGEEFSPHRVPYCIASECMMWRTSYATGDDGFCGMAGAGGPYGYPPQS